jgi:predicted PurR-regulated permease PerM
MNEQVSPRRKTHILVILAALVIIVFGISQAQSVLVLLLISVFLAVLGTPAVLWLERKKVPNAAAVLLVIAGMIAVLLVIGALVGASIASFSASLPQYQSRLQEQLVVLKEFLANKGIAITDKLLTDYVNPAAVMSFTAVLLAGLSSALSSIVLILLTVLFILLEVSGFKAKLRASPGDPEKFLPRFTTFVDQIQRYVVIKTIISLTTGVLVGVWMVILGVQYPVLWGFLAFLLNYVPNIGVVIAMIPAALFAAIQLGLGSAALVIVGYLAFNFIIGTALEPKIVGKGVGLSTLVVFLSLILWGTLLGLIGAVLCVPITMTLKFLLEINDETRWMGVWLGPSVEEAGAARLKGKVDR